MNKGLIGSFQLEDFLPLKQCGIISTENETKGSNVSYQTVATFPAHGFNVVVD